MKSVLSFLLSRALAVSPGYPGFPPAWYAASRGLVMFDLGEFTEKLNGD